jgi:hypothetical protein
VSLSYRSWKNSKFIHPSLRHQFLSRLFSFGITHKEIIKIPQFSIPSNILPLLYTIHISNLKTNKPSNRPCQFSIQCRTSKILNKNAQNSTCSKNTITGARIDRCCICMLWSCRTLMSFHMVVTLFVQFN